MNCDPAIIFYYPELIYSPYVSNYRSCFKEILDYVKKRKNNRKLINSRLTGVATGNCIMSLSKSYNGLLDAKNRMIKFASVLQLRGGGDLTPPLGQQRYKNSVVIRGLIATVP